MNSINHVAIIMDGNGRWGLKHKRSRNLGHKAGLLTVEKILKESIKNKVKYLTLYTFSTDNWKRPEKEVNFLFNLLETFLLKKINTLIKNKIRLKILGDNTFFTAKLKKILKDSEYKTRNNNKIQVNIALNYGSKNEIINAVKLLNKNKKLITEKDIENYLYTKNIPDPDLLIRTGNTKRLSNFLLWQIAYTEIFFEKKLWPDFTVKDYKKILNTFKELKRNFGSI
jgi:undecaprenyl diphosphate synthase